MSKSSKSLYPEVIESNPESTSQLLSNADQRRPTSSSSSSSIYPSIDLKDLAQNLFPDDDNHDVQVEIQQAPDSQRSIAFESSEEVIIKIPGAILHLIDKE